MKHVKLSDNHNKEDKATRFSDIRTPVKFGKPRGFSDSLNRYGHVFFQKNNILHWSQFFFCIDRESVKNTLQFPAKFTADTVTRD